MEERAGVLDDLAELEVFRTLLEPNGIKGIVVECPDCDEEHHVDWALMQANLRQLLEEGQTGRHEPPFEPDPDDYVSWDYASGDRKSTRLNSSHANISYAVFCLKKKKQNRI